MRLKHLKKYTTLLRILVFLTCCFHTGSASGSNYVPTKGWRISSPEAQGMDSEKLNDMLEETLQEKYSIDSITIIRNGYIDLDAYFYPFKKDTKHIIHSCTKSITSAAFGIAVDKGYIKNIDQQVLKIFPEKQFAHLDDGKKAITLKNLLTMTAGLNTEDSYIYRWRGLNEMIQAKDWVQFVLDRPIAEKPGTRFEYSNCVAFLLSAIIQKNTQMNTFDFLKKHLFNPLGISDVRWAATPEGISVGYGRMWLTPHDMAKIGWLYLNNGRWGDQQTISEKWVKDSTRKHVNATLFDGYGYQWWISPEKYFVAVGHEGQFIFVVPKKNVVVVFTSILEGNDFFIPVNLLSEFIIPATVSETPLPENSKQAARLNRLINKGAESQPYVWNTEKEGMAKDSLFTRTATPAFKFTYPTGSIQIELDPSIPNQVMSMRTLDNIRFSAYVVDVANNISLKDFGPNYYAPKLKAFSPYVSDLAIISNKEIVLNDNTTAYRTDIKYKYRGFLMNLVVVAAQRKNQYVYISASLWDGLKLEDGVKIVESLTFE